MELPKGVALELCARLDFGSPSANPQRTPSQIHCEVHDKPPEQKPQAKAKAKGNSAAKEVAGKGNQRKKAPVDLPTDFKTAQKSVLGMGMDYSAMEAQAPASSEAPEQPAASARVIHD